MKVRLWGTRGSLPSGAPENVRYGGNTSCVEVRGEGSCLVLDAGTGVRRAGAAIDPDSVKRVDILLTHLHMDHIQGLGFFRPLYQEGMEVHIWGPASRRLDLRMRLTKYLSPPLFPVPLRDLPCKWELHDVRVGEPFEIGSLRITADFVAHPGATLGYRIEERSISLVYLPDHEPALGRDDIPEDRSWLSGFRLAEGADLLLHDSQYFAEEYAEKIGWGHSTVDQSLAFAGATAVKRLVTFHHDPWHSDTVLDKLHNSLRKNCALPFELIAGQEGTVLQLAG
jgi:phosphoribosyl 1,2-cyclic phosphodiesterase